jgi:hypothetical protein
MYNRNKGMHLFHKKFVQLIKQLPNEKLAQNKANEVEVW